MAQLLAHGNAHNLLFSFCTDELVTLNDDSEPYPSPQREDLRPLEGIYHTNYIFARMYRCIHTLLKSGILNETGEEKAQELLANNAAFFRSGRKTVNTHGRLSPLGRDLMENALAAMDAVAVCQDASTVSGSDSVFGRVPPIV